MEDSTVVLINQKIIVLVEKLKSVFFKVKQDFEIDLGNTFYIGGKDKELDILAAKEAE